MAKPRKKKSVSLARVAFGAASLKIEMVEIADPYALKPGQTIIAARNLTPLADLFNKKRIDNSQKLAGEQFAEKYSRAELGGAQAIDYTREHVDGGPTPEPLSEQQQEALDWLRGCARYPGIGKEGFAVLRAICGEEKTISAYAKQVSMKRGGGYGIAKRLRVEEGFVSLRLFEALDCLVEHLDLIGEGPQRPDRPRIRKQSGDNLAGMGGAEYEIDSIGDLVLKR